MTYKQQYNYFDKFPLAKIKEVIRFILKFNKLKNKKYMNKVDSIMLLEEISERQRMVLINFILDNN